MRDYLLLNIASFFIDNWGWLVSIVYIIALVLICLRIIYDTRSNAKALAYLMLVIFVPLLGMFLYFSVGVNHRKRKIFSNKSMIDEKLAKKLREEVSRSAEHIFDKDNPALEANKELALMLIRDSMSPLTANNKVKLLINGELKFPDVMEAIRSAKNHIHLEYYIYEDDEIGCEIEELLIQKAKEGVDVRFIYDDFGSKTIRKKMVPRLKKGGVKAFPFYRVIFWAFANRLNYRNHRKIIVIDGHTGFVGGINVSDKYVNKEAPDKKRLFWRDTHLRIEGAGVLYLQYLFLCDWNFCSGDHLKLEQHFFPKASDAPVRDGKIVQIAASGPDSEKPTVLFALLQAIYLATEEILITTPYFIPGDSILDALVVSALGGVKVKLLVPGISDSVLVNAAARSYYDDLLAAGVEIYFYKKGFVHAKTMVTDRKTVMVGSANMDYRSFDLNFEVNAVIYDKAMGEELRAIFYDDLKDAERVDPERWKNRSWNQQLWEKTARLVSPLL